MTQDTSMIEGRHSGAPSQAPFVLYSAMYAMMGLLVAIPGPVLPELEKQAHITAAGMGTVLLYRGVGSMAGGVTVGFILDVVPDPHVVLVVLSVVKAACELTMPFSESLMPLGVQFFVVLFCGNAIAIVAMTAISWTYGELMGLQMNVASAVFGVGCMAAPMLAAISHDIGSRAVYAFWAIAVVDIVLMVAAIFIPSTKNPKLAKSIDGPPVMRTRTISGELDGEAHSAYVKLREDKLEEDWYAVTLCGLVVLLAQVVSISIAFWLFTYVTEILGLTAEAAVTVNIVFYVVSTAARFLGGWLITFTSAASILQGCLACAVSASLGFLCPQFVATLPCLSMIGVAVSISPLLANSVTVLGQRSFISGRAQGFLGVCASLGAMLGSSGVGFLQKWPTVGDAALPTVVLLGLVALVFATAGLLKR